MGFFHGGVKLGPSVDDVVVVTPREFTRLVAGTLCAVRGPGESDTYQPGVTSRAGRSTVEKLSAHVRAFPDDAAAHRVLAIAHLSAGHAHSAARHLVIAADILLRLCADAPTLEATLRAHLELKLLGVVLVPHYLRLGRARIVHRLLMEVLLVW